MVIFVRHIQRALLRAAAVVTLMFLFSLLWIQEARSESSSAKISAGDSVLRSESQTVTLSSGQSHRYKLIHYVNRYGEKEVQVSLVEAHWLAKDTQLVVLRGRDIDFDGLLDTWFYTEGSIVKGFQRQSKSMNAWETIEEILKELSLNESRWISTLATRELLGGLFFTIEGEIQDARALEQAQIDLMDLDFKIKDFESKNENRFLIQELKRVSNEGWLRLVNQMTNGQVQDRQNRVFGDLAVMVGGAAALRSAKFLLVKALSSESVVTIKTYLSEALQQQKMWLKKVTGRVATYAGSKAELLGPTIKPIKAGAVQVLSSLRFASQSEALSWLSRNSVLSRTLKQIGSVLKETGTASWDRRGYIAMAQTIQLAVESYNRGYWELSEAPLILDHPVQSTKEFINQVANDKGLLQNLSYMTLQTTLLSGVSEALSRKGAGLGLKYAICSMVTLVDSASVNVLVQGNTNFSRVSFDTAWELIVGGTQVQADLVMIRWGEALAKKFTNRKLKAVGYLLGSLDQAAGYYFYNKATSKFFEKKQDSVVPSGSEMPFNDQLPADLPPVLVIPVLAPIS